MSQPSTPPSIYDVIGLASAVYSFAVAAVPADVLARSLTGVELFRVLSGLVSLLVVVWWIASNRTALRADTAATRAAVEAAEARTAARLADYRVGMDALARQIGDAAAMQIEAAGEVTAQANRHWVDQGVRDGETRRRVDALTRTVAELERRRAG